MNVKVSITGVQEIDRVLRGLEPQLSHQVLSSAHASAAKPLIEKEKLLAPEGPTGNLVDSIGAIKTPFKRANVIGEVTVGPRRSRRHKGHAGHLVEFGTKVRRTLKGANRGLMRARAFAQPAFQATQNIVVNNIATEVGRKLYSFMRRTIKG
jgi:threonyl-tRNA synthetase